MPKKNKYIGVTCVDKDPTRVHYKAAIYLNHRAVTVTGQFNTARDAAIAYDKVAIRYNKQTNILKQIK